MYMRGSFSAKMMASLGLLFKCNTQFSNHCFNIFKLNVYVCESFFGQNKLFEFCFALDTTATSFLLFRSNFCVSIKKQIRQQIVKSVRQSKNQTIKCKYQFSNQWINQKIKCNNHFENQFVNQKIKQSNARIIFKIKCVSLINKKNLM